jgi:hypothetical protein
MGDAYNCDALSHMQINSCWRWIKAQRSFQSAGSWEAQPSEVVGSCKQLFPALPCCLIIILFKSVFKFCFIYVYQLNNFSGDLLVCILLTTQQPDGV